MPPLVPAAQCAILPPWDLVETWCLCHLCPNMAKKRPKAVTSVEMFLDFVAANMDTCKHLASCMNDHFDDPDGDDLRGSPERSNELYSETTTCCGHPNHVVG